MNIYLFSHFLIKKKKKLDKKMNIYLDFFI